MDAAAALVGANMHGLIDQDNSRRILGRWLEMFPEGAEKKQPTLLVAYTYQKMFSADSFVYNFFGGFQWNIFNYGRLKNNVRLQDAAFQQLLEDYRQTMLQAQAEVENAIVAYLQSHHQLKALQSAASAAQRAADVSSAQYEDGLVDFNTVISTLRALASQQDQLAAIQGTVATNLVAVYRALGGGWEIRQGKKPVDLIPDDTREEMLERGSYWKRTFEKE